MCYLLSLDFLFVSFTHLDKHVMVWRLNPKGKESVAFGQVGGGGPLVGRKRSQTHELPRRYTCIFFINLFFLVGMGLKWSCFLFYCFRFPFLRTRHRKSQKGQPSIGSARLTSGMGRGISRSRLHHHAHKRYWIIV